MIRYYFFSSCVAVDQRTVYMYCEIRPQDKNTKLDKLISYFQDRSLVRSLLHETVSA